MPKLNHATIRSLFAIGMILSCIIGYGQEDCDNSIDDDGDGMIDLNDEDCECIPSSAVLINGDFELFTCCPENVSSPITLGIECLAGTWGAGYSGSTPDYFNTCDYIGGEGTVPQVPLPMPSGNGAVGIVSSGNYLETIGSCLGAETLDAGTTYTLSFYLGVNGTGPLNSPLSQ